MQAEDIKQITAQEYITFCEEYLFDHLREIHFGEAFAQRFGFTDVVFTLPLSTEFVKEHIKTSGYVR